MYFTGFGDWFEELGVWLEVRCISFSHVILGMCASIDMVCHFQLLWLLDNLSTHTHLYRQVFEKEHAI